jgi:hydroxymethylpyrimidine/phosphomethylpyrimidine kinase
VHSVALTIAGSDPSGGAGIQADIRTFTAFGVYGAAVIAALTAQNTLGVAAIREIPPAFMEAQLRTLLEDVKVDAVKTGMLLSARTVSLVADAVRRYRLRRLVIDPVMVSTSGKRLLRKGAVAAMLDELFPLAMLVTPNLSEASLISGIAIETVRDMEEAARLILKLGPKAVLVKGGHLKGDAVDVLYDGRTLHYFKGKRVEGVAIHGAGCVYSAAITAGLAKGMEVKDAVSEAKKFVTKAIKKAEPVGKGRVPLR